MKKLSKKVEEIFEKEFEKARRNMFIEETDEGIEMIIGMYLPKKDKTAIKLSELKVNIPKNEYSEGIIKGWGKINNTVTFIKRIFKSTLVNEYYIDNNKRIDLDKSKYEQIKGFIQPKNKVTKPSLVIQ